MGIYIIFPVPSREKAEEVPAASRSPSFRTTVPSSDLLVHFNLRALLARISITKNGVPILPQIDSPSTLGTMGLFVRRRIIQLLKIGVIRSIPHIQFGLEGSSAFRAILPVPGVLLRMMVCTKRISAVVSRTTVAGVRKNDIFILIITDPLSATLGSNQFFRLPTKATFRFSSRPFLGGLALGCHDRSFLHFLTHVILCIGVL
jgi:hypothetical protein